MLRLYYWIILILFLIALFFIYKGLSIILQIFKGHGVPNVTSNQDIIQALEKEIVLDSDSVFFDLGAGNGTIVSMVQSLHPESRCIGIEAAPVAFKLAERKKKNSWWSYELLKQDLFATDLSQATHIYSYLMPHLMKKVWNKISTECKPWTLFYVNAFEIPDVKAIKEIELERKGKFVKKLWVYEV